MFKLRCDVGIFVFEEAEDGKYRAEANGIRCDIDSDSVMLFYGGESHLLFYDGDLESELPKLREKIDTELLHLMDNDDEDVRYLDTSEGRVAFYMYNAHLPGNPVVFLHGGPGGSSNTVRARRLQLDRPIFLYDQMGCGRSDKIKDLKSWNHENYADELKEVISLMGFKKVSFAAASWGAGLAALYAIHYGCLKIESMMLVSPFFSTMQWEADQRENLARLGKKYLDAMDRYICGKGSRKEYIAVMEAYDSRYLYSQVVNRDLAIVAANEEPNEVFKAMIGENEMHTVGNMKDFEIIDKLDLIRTKVLILNGDSDEVTLNTAKMYRDKIKGSELKIVRGAGHALSFEQFDAYAIEARGFL